MILINDIHIKELLKMLAKFENKNELPCAHCGEVPKVAKKCSECNQVFCVDCFNEHSCDRNGINYTYILKQQQDREKFNERIFELSGELEWDRERDEGDDDEILFVFFGNYHSLQFQSFAAVEEAVMLSDEEFIEKLKEAKQNRDIEIKSET